MVFRPKVFAILPSTYAPTFRRVQCNIGTTCYTMVIASTAAYINHQCHSMSNILSKEQNYAQNGVAFFIIYGWRLFLMGKCICGRCLAWRRVSGEVPALQLHRELPGFPEVIAHFSLVCQVCAATVRWSYMVRQVLPELASSSLSTNFPMKQRGLERRC